tara:strand:- start:145 stop:513 length:369 start_codon:yes stop_codon:yes gene_type:complete
MKNILKGFFLLIFLTTNNVAQEDLNNKILKNLRCLVCQGQTISDSNSSFAETIKSVVNDKIKEGMTEKQIYNFLSEKYGDWILFDPPLKKNSYVLWFLPYLLFVLGTLFLFFLFKRSPFSKK